MATSKKKQAADRPYTVDEMAQIGMLPKTAEIPAQVAEALGTQRLNIDGVGKAPRFGQADSADQTWELALPAGAQVGRAGRSGERLARAEKVAGPAHTEPMRPDWSEQTFQPFAASESFRHGPMRRHKGVQLEPYYGVYGSDDRTVYYPSTYPWRCIGRIFTWTNWAGGGGWDWWGSGVLVGPRHVLTAGHVCPWGSGSWAMKFVPSYWNGSPIAGSGAVSYASDYRGWDTDETVAGNDYAVLRLYDPIGSWLGWMGTKSYDSGWNGGNYWTLAGYPAAIAGGERPSDQSGIPVLDTDGADDNSVEIEHHGDATGGDSGGPFFGFWNDGPYAVGVTSGGERIYGTPFGWWDEDNNIEAGGGGMVDLVRWGLNNWP
jgi:V8-like Glu-specific endopeptidase